MRRCILTGAVLVLTGGALNAEMVVEWWGESARCRHRTMKIDLSFYGKAGMINPKMGKRAVEGIHAVRVDLSAIPKGAEVYHASLRMQAPLKRIRTDKRAYMSIGGGHWYHDPLRLYAEMPPWKPVEVYVAAPGSARNKPVYDPAAPLKLEGPQFKSLDVTEAVRGWVSGKAANLGFVVRQLDLWDWTPGATVLEVRYEGKPADRPNQAKDLKVFHRKGQTFITWTEVEKIIEKDPIEWAEFQPIFKKHSPRGNTFYRIYRHDERITPANLHRAELVNEIWPLSGYDTRSHQHVTHGEEWAGLDPRCIVHRYWVHDPPAGPVGAVQWWNKELPLHTGLYVHQPAKAGKAFYAVTVLVDGVENTADLTAANSLAGPVAETVGTGGPTLYRVLDQSRRRGRQTEYRETQFFMYWAAPPYANLPRHPIHIMVSLRGLKPGESMDVVYEGDGMYGSSLVGGPNLHGWRKGDRRFTIVSDAAFAGSAYKSNFNTLIASTEAKRIPYAAKIFKLFTPWAKALTPRLKRADAENQKKKAN